MIEEYYMGMDADHRRISDCLTEKMEKLCGERESCKGCPHKDWLHGYFGGCREKVAIDMILEEERKNGKCTKTTG